MLANSVLWVVLSNVVYHTALAGLFVRTLVEITVSDITQRGLPNEWVRTSPSTSAVTVLLFHFRFGFSRFFTENRGFGFSRCRFLHEIWVKQTVTGQLVDKPTRRQQTRRQTNSPTHQLADSLTRRQSASGIFGLADLRTCGPTNGYFADRKMRTVFADRWVKCGPADP